MSCTLLELTRVEEGVGKEDIANTTISNIQEIKKKFPNKFSNDPDHYLGTVFKTDDLLILIYPVLQGGNMLLTHYEVCCRLPGDHYFQIAFLAEQFKDLNNKKKIMPAIFMIEEQFWMSRLDDIFEEALST